MPDTSGPAFPFTFKDLQSGEELTHKGMSKRLYLIAHAPPPPAGWIAGEVDNHLSIEDRSKAAHRDAWDKAIKRGENGPTYRTPTPAPTAPDLGIRWRMAWADRVLQMNSE